MEQKRTYKPHIQRENELRHLIHGGKNKLTHLIHGAKTNLHTLYTVQKQTYGPYTRSKNELTHLIHGRENELTHLTHRTKTNLQNGNVRGKIFKSHIFTVQMRNLGTFVLE